MEELIKENLSRKFIEAIASRKGFKCTKPDTDSGVDLSVTRTVANIRNGSKRFTDTGEYVELQLKATTEKSISSEAKVVKYDLEAKTYNDLVQRIKSGALTPLYLLVFVLPSDKTKWLEVTPAELKIRKIAYWYKPKDSEDFTDNKSTIRISIPKKQIVDLSFFDNCFKEVYS